MDYLRGHPKWCTDEGPAFSQSGRNLGRNAKVGQFDVTSLSQQNIGALDVAVHLAAAVQVGQAQQSLFAHESDLGLR